MGAETLRSRASRASAAEVDRNASRLSGYCTIVAPCICYLDMYTPYLNVWLLKPYVAWSELVAYRGPATEIRQLIPETLQDRGNEAHQYNSMQEARGATIGGA